MEHYIDTTKNRKLHNIEDHWFSNVLDDEIDSILKEGVHHKNCDSNFIENKNNTIICCGKTLCYFCNTIMHGCTNNECFYINNNLIKCHSFCINKNK